MDRESKVVFCFPECDKLSPPVVQLDEVSFRYSPEQDMVFRAISIGADMESRICIVCNVSDVNMSHSSTVVVDFSVGDNGSGKTTLLKLLMGDLDASNGLRRAHRHLKIGYFAQHHVDQLQMNVSALQLTANRFPGTSHILHRLAWPGTCQHLPPARTVIRL